MTPTDEHSSGAASAIRDERGFTLIELLIACLILGLLATVALSTFLGRRTDAGDAVAKGLLNTAEQTAANYGLTNGYLTMTPAALKALEPTINILANGKAVLVNANPTANGYVLTVVSGSADTYTLTYAAGVITRTCLVAAGNGNTTTNTGGGCTGGKW
jgi:prepilin-type N-terminal cleavage/methylation domain-containing protein